MSVRPSFMASARGEALPLEDVAIDATLHDLMAEVEVTQVYRNQERTSIEAVYTFPLPLDAVLLGLAVTIGERRLRGTVVEKSAAEARYENAIADGDAAVMLEQAEPGLYTMNVGNVLPGERVSVCLRYGQALRWSGDAVRFFMPTTVAPRYGASPLPPHQVPEASLTVENRFALTVRVRGVLRSARMECPSHALRYEIEEGVAVLSLAAERVVMDRDFVLLLTAAGAERAWALTDHDTDGTVVFASFQPRFGGLAQTHPRSFKIVVDCSGSMAGDSITQAKQALAAIVDRLRPADRLNIVAFGSTTRALFNHQKPCTAANLQRAREFCGTLVANLGGTEIGAALERAYASRTGGELPEDVLLITDGEVANWQPVVDRARTARHRVFTVGVGASVAEAFVRTLAERTGGAAELVSPGEGMADRITRHFQRMTAPVATNARIVWPAGAREQWPTDQRCVLDGDTVFAWARFTEQPAGEVTFEVAGDGAAAFRQSVRVPPAPGVTGCVETGPSSLARIAAAMRLPDLDERRARTEALAYALMSKWTNYIVVGEREEKEKATALPELRKVKQSLAAGWGGTAVLQGPPTVFEDSNLDFSQCLDVGRTASFRSPSPSVPLLRAVKDELGSRVAELRALVDALNAAPARIRALLTLDDLRSLGVPDDLLREARVEVFFGTPGHEAVLHFLEQLAQSAVGAALSAEVKREIRVAMRMLQKAPASPAVSAAGRRRP